LISAKTDDDIRIKVIIKNLKVFIFSPKLSSLLNQLKNNSKSQLRW
jgi:hypothetical protein